MGVLSATIQKKVEKALVEQGLIDESKFSKVYKEADSKNIPVFSLLVSGGYVSNEELTKNYCSCNENAIR